MNYWDKILTYLKAGRRGKQANQLEGEAMFDPFLNDALDGFSAFDDNEQILADIDKLQQRINQRSHKRNKNNTMRWVAASVALLLAVGAGYWAFNTNKPEQNQVAVLHTDKKDETKLMDIGSDKDAENKDVENERVKEEPTTVKAAANKDIVQSKAGKKAISADIDVFADKMAVKDNQLLGKKESQVAEEVATIKSYGDIAYESKIVTNKPIALAEKAEQQEQVVANAIFDEVVVVGYGSVKKKVDASVATTTKSTTMPEGTKYRLPNFTEKTKVINEGEASSEQELEPVIGRQVYIKYLADSIVYPASAVVDIDAKVTLVFLVNNEGRPYNVQVMRGLDKEYNDEAIRLVNEGCNWTPSTVEPQKRVILQVKFKKYRQ